MVKPNPGLPGAQNCQTYKTRAALVTIVSSKRTLGSLNQIFKMAVMEVQSWSGDWNLPSIDIRCLEVLVRKLVSLLSDISSESLFEALHFVL